MHTSILKRVLALAGLALAAASPSYGADGNKAPARFDLAVTVDDLTVHGPLPRGLSWTGIADSHIATLAAHRSRKPGAS